MTNMTEGPVAKRILCFSIPVLLTYFIQLLYNTTDTIFVGQYLGTNAQAAVGAGANFITVLVGLLGGITTGVSVLMGQRFGAKDTSGMTRATTAAMALAAVSSLFLTILGWCLAKPFLVLIHCPKAILPLAVSYLKIYCLSIPAMFFYNMGVGMLRAIGNSTRPMWYQLAGGLLNVFLDWLFLVRLQLGAVGSAWGTMLAQTFVTVFLYVMLFHDSIFTVSGSSLPDLFQDMKRILQVGLPAGFQAMLITLSNVLVQSEINRFGAEAIAAFTAYFEIELLLWYPIVSFGQAVSVFVSQNVGAENKNRAERGIRATLVMGSGYTLVMSALSVLLSAQLFSIFTKDPTVVALGTQIIRFTFPFYVLYVFLQVLGDALRAMQYSTEVMWIILLNIGAFRVALLYALIHSVGTITAIATIYPITWFTAAVSMTVCYKYKKKKGLFAGQVRRVME